mmetsp:Transcript_64896/g.79399  ORF Transcript_64896/g.79399 Transcript_64896/m.79399 type:complete len:290 (-) Transcript_64896:99-968(-)
MAKKKEAKPAKDQALQWICVLSGIVSLVCLVPKIPYRHALIFTGYHQRFPLERTYSLFGASNKMGQMVSWFKWQTQTCNMMKEYAKSNPLLAAVGGIAAAKSGVGGAAAGCQYWDMCKTQLAVRCTEYATMAVMSILAMLFQLIGAGAALCVPVMLNSESDAGKDKKGSKKEKAKKAAVGATMSCALAGGLLPFLSWAIYMGASGAMMSNLKMKEAYAYGYAYVGSYIALVGWILGLIGGFIAFRRFQTFGKEKEKDDEDEPAANANMPSDMPAMGAMPGMPPTGPPAM